MLTLGKLGWSSILGPVSIQRCSNVSPRKRLQVYDWPILILGLYCKRGKRRVYFVIQEVKLVLLWSLHISACRAYITAHFRGGSLSSLIRLYRHSICCNCVALYKHSVLEMVSSHVLEMLSFILPRIKHSYLRYVKYTTEQNM